MLAQFEKGENVTVAKFGLAFTRYRQNLKMTGNSTEKNTVQTLPEFDTKEMYLHLKDYLASF